MLYPKIKNKNQKRKKINANFINLGKKIIFLSINFLQSSEYLLLFIEKSFHF